MVFQVIIRCGVHVYMYTCARFILPSDFYDNFIYIASVMVVFVNLVILSYIALVES